MASFQQDRSGTFRFSFRFANQRFKCSLQTMADDSTHLARIHGDGKLLRSVTTSDLQMYVPTRSKEAGHRGTVTAATIHTEIATFRALWNWAVSQDLISRPFPGKRSIFLSANDSFASFASARDFLFTRPLALQISEVRSIRRV